MINKDLNKVENTPMNELTSNLKGYIGKGHSEPGTVSLRNNVKSETIYISLDQFLEPELKEYVPKRNAKDMVRDLENNHAINLEKDAGIEIINPNERKDAGIEIIEPPTRNENPNPSDYDVQKIAIPDNNEKRETFDSSTFDSNRIDTTGLRANKEDLDNYLNNMGIKE